MSETNIDWAKTERIPQLRIPVKNSSPRLGRGKREKKKQGAPADLPTGPKGLGSKSKGKAPHQHRKGVL